MRGFLLTVFVLGLSFFLARVIVLNVIRLIGKQQLVEGEPQSFPADLMNMVAAVFVCAIGIGIFLFFRLIINVYISSK